MSPFLLSPSIIASNFLKLGDEIAACEAAGADWIHVDVMDGHFVPTITVGPLFVEACRRATKLPLDVHLMITNPLEHFDEFVKAGASGLTVHVETCPDLPQIIEKIKSYGCRAGVTLNPLTPVSTLDAVLPMVDLVLVMSVNPGYSGQAFMPEMIDKVREIRNRLDVLQSKAYLEVDGGITTKTLPLMYNAGANVFVTGNSAFKNPKGVGEGIRLLRECVVP
jgi:ribulose-phosphate 3-epimerase